MELMIDGTEVLEADEIVRSAEYVDYFGGHADVLEISFIDEEEIIEVSKGTEIKVSNEMVTTGTMYVSRVELSGKNKKIRALSIKAEQLDVRSYVREQITLSEACIEAGKEIGFKMNYSPLGEYTYASLQRINQNSISFLNFLTEREGYVLKIWNNITMIENELAHEQSESVLEFSDEDFLRDPVLKTSDAALIRKIENRYKGKFLIHMAVEDPTICGKNMNISLPVQSIGESERLTRQMMKNLNKFDTRLTAAIDMQELRAGNCIEYTENNSFSGKYLIYAMRHDFVAERQLIKGRLVR